MIVEFMNSRGALKNTFFRFVVFRAWEVTLGKWRKRGSAREVVLGTRRMERGARGGDLPACSGRGSARTADDTIVEDAIVESEMIEALNARGAEHAESTAAEDVRFQDKDL